MHLINILLIFYIKKINLKILQNTLLLEISLFLVSQNRPKIIYHTKYSGWLNMTNTIKLLIKKREIHLNKNYLVLHTNTLNFNIKNQQYIYKMHLRIELKLY